MGLPRRECVYSPIYSCQLDIHRIHVLHSYVPFESKSYERQLGDKEVSQTHHFISGKHFQLVNNG
ncbi:hypothetical protein HanRHA438_Chr05g0219111 [Helianthus annuus]|uniref:Uncharacterized protein n=1 Tax=Helianthus annuus TaxID=4232 RepID=A0A9K3IYR3_HELAN|nr:hypothetical protein HanXRQr2_Chr05g0209601 [Helianthus annuus]KAJ0918539.1 hypothetical protein HanRHA438_Chr05g0219111 [Helianthus annuus]KAJ0922341.1 hypothetical protein HanPSC8_Chr05g0202651 [Helianthus annuus]